MLVIGSVLCAGIFPVHAKEGMIQIKGSDTIVNLSQAWAEAFMAENSQASLAVTGGGSGTGIAALING
ncbi:MAG: substrate-binding domain-containing protein, partial [Candidatus Omnitrophica bacterium]|nr:substrate-binding domain-containing protein [Candidatus Omnitrophota bacterium]